MCFDYNAYHAARPGMRPHAPGAEKCGKTKKAGFDYNAYHAARPGMRPPRPGNDIGNCLAYGKKTGFDYNAYHAARPGTRPHRPGLC